MARSLFLPSWLAPLLLSVLLGAVGAGACASRARPPLKYPPRRPGCALSVFHSELPDLTAWDDIGKVEVLCHIDETEATCFSRLRTEVCRMGGDIVYRLPLKPWRPKEEKIGYRAMVAHTRAPVAPAATPTLPRDEPPPASPEESAGPVVPLTGPAAPRPVRDAGDAGAQG